MTAPDVMEWIPTTRTDGHFVLMVRTMTGERRPATAAEIEAYYQRP